ncbi:MAG TPA: DUF559 domain-containing protein, partial [Anaerolineae bacterium]|nr:DUF559 domain-containing protein [Anaerolineae bacterium]
NPVRAALVAKESLVELERFLTLFDESGGGPFQGIPAEKRGNIVSERERAGWLSTIEAELATRHKQATKKPLDDSYQGIRKSLGTEKVHPCLRQLSDALKKFDPKAWEVAWKQWEHVRSWQSRLTKYEQLLIRIGQVCPELEVILRENQGREEWKSHVLQLKKAWAWASARGWLHEVSDRNRYPDLMRTVHRLQDKKEAKIEEIAALRAWDAFFARLDDTTIQNLKAWTKAVDRLGKGTGKHAYKHRRTARDYLMACIPKIPAWIMPLHKLWDTVDAEPGLFDTIIIDEASQAGIDSLALLLLAKKIIVVGDDKQNSPEAVFVREDDIARLAREHLSEFHFREEFRPDASLFDHAERAFGNLISLREHFRCVPEIIRFSNDLCYTDSPLIPLRQAPPERLPPLQATYIDGGICEGDGQRIHNLAEAEAVVEAILKCLEDDAYEGKSMGVIALQGRAQAELVARKLSEGVDPKIISERKLRCGVPATFQGDERDVMFLSLVMAPNVHHRALTRLPDVRRFNVAMSRARDQIWLFHSMKLQDLSAMCLRRRLMNFFEHRRGGLEEGLAEDLKRLELEARKSPRHPGEQPEPYESWFEVDVALELLRRGYRIWPQYEVASKWIDIVVEGLEARLAVECDGDAWHGPEQYEKDMARQRQLERVGWTFVRVRESEFYANRTKAVEEIIRACDDLEIHPVSISEEPVKERAKDQPSDEISEFDEESLEDFVSSEKGPFTGYSPDLGFPDPRYASTSNVRAALRKIIEKDGPLTRASVYRLYEEGCPHVHRVGKAVRQSLNFALGAMLRGGEIVQENEFGSRSPMGIIIRTADTPRVRERPAGRRDLQEIPPSELLMILERFQEEIHSEDIDAGEALFRRILDHYGYSKLTLPRRQHLERLLRLSEAPEKPQRESED